MTSPPVQGPVTVSLDQYSVTPTAAVTQPQSANISTVASAALSTVASASEESTGPGDPEEDTNAPEGSTVKSVMRRLAKALSLSLDVYSGRPCSKTPPTATGHMTGIAPSADPGKQKQATRPMVDACVTVVDPSVRLPSQTPSQTRAPVPDPVRFTPRKAKVGVRYREDDAHGSLECDLEEWNSHARRSKSERRNRVQKKIHTQSAKDPMDAPARNNTTAENEASAPRPVVEAAKKSAGKEIAKEGVHYGIYDGKLAKEHANWVDTSEDELHDDTDFEDLLMESDDNKQDERNLDEDANVDEDDEFQDPQDPVSADHNPPVVLRNGPTTASDV
ncbi:unnamed protein product [Calypogeia fissa]